MTFPKVLSVRLGQPYPYPYPQTQTCRGGRHTVCKVANSSYYVASSQQFNRGLHRRSYRMLVRSDKRERGDIQNVEDIELNEMENEFENDEMLAIIEKDGVIDTNNGNNSQNGCTQELFVKNGHHSQNGVMQESQVKSLSTLDGKNETRMTTSNLNLNSKQKGIDIEQLKQSQNNTLSENATDNEVLKSQTPEIVHQVKTRKVQQRKSRSTKHKGAENSVLVFDSECDQLVKQQDSEQELQKEASSSNHTKIVENNKKPPMGQNGSQTLEEVNVEFPTQTKKSEILDIPLNGNQVLETSEQTSNNSSSSINNDSKDSNNKEKGKRIRRTQRMSGRDAMKESNEKVEEGKETVEISKKGNEESQTLEKDNVKVLGQTEARKFFEEMDEFDEGLLEYLFQNMTASRLSAKLPVRIVSGVGKKNEKLLKEAGCSFLWQLLFLFQFRFMGSEEEMVQYLKDVGVKKYKKSIIDFLKEQSLVRNAVITLEGNIGAGKTTFLKTLSKYTRSKIKIIEEPVAEWQEVRNTAWMGQQNDGPEYFNLLENFYQQPHQAFQFQTFVLGTKMGNSAYVNDPWHYDSLSSIKQSPNVNDMVHLLERSVFADRLVFVRSLHEKKYMNDQEVSIYDQLFDRLVNYQSPNLYPDGFVYLRAEPDVCENRMKRRNRQEEQGVTYDYLRGLHYMHEDWLHNNSLRDVSEKNVKAVLQRRRESRFRSNQNYQILSDTSSNIELEMIRNLMYDTLDIAKIHSIPTVPECLLDSDLATVQLIDPSQNKFVSKYPGLAGIPTLEVNWNQDWDVEGDTQRLEKIANIVESFVDWVSRYKALIRIPELLPVNYTYNESRSY